MFKKPVKPVSLTMFEKALSQLLVRNDLACRRCRNIYPNLASACPVSLAFEMVGVLQIFVKLCNCLLPFILFVCVCVCVCVRACVRACVRVCV